MTGRRDIDLTVVIVNWNVRELLRRCLRSVLASAAASVPPLGLQIIVVDNGSSDGSADMVRAEFPDVRLIANADNPGFAAANNQGLALARGRYVLLLNPDTECLGDSLPALVRYADAHPDVGLVGPQLLNSDGSVQSSRRRFPTLATALFESTWLEPWAPQRVLERYRLLDQPDDAILDVDWVTGAAMLARREAVETVGGLDEGYFMYSEEMDWCRQIKVAGWRVVYFPAVQIVHHVGKSSEQAVPARHIHFQRSKIRYFHKYHGSLAAAGLRLFLLANYAWQFVLEAAKWLVAPLVPEQREKRGLRRQRMRAYYQVLKSRL